MKLTMIQPVEIEADSIRLSVAVRYGTEDIPDDFPFRKGDLWEVTIDLHTRKIRDWPGPAAHVGMKVTDCGCYYLMNGDKVVAVLQNEYVPSCLPQRYGDYLDFNIAADGTLEGWEPSAKKLAASFDAGTPDDD